MILQNKPADVTAAAAGKPRAGMKLFVREGAPVGAVDINAEALDVRAKETENKGRKDPRRSLLIFHAQKTWIRHRRCGRQAKWD